MEQERRARRKALRIIITEALMVLTVVVTVIALAFIVSGYWINSNFEVERQGMLQVSSVPTDALVSVDGESPWFQHTNTSKVLTSGEHNITLTKDGYDSWSKTIDIKEFLLYRLNYPRLFLQNRYKETVYTPSGVTFATISPNHRLLLLTNNTTDWSLIDLNNEKIEAKTLNIAKAFNIDIQKDHQAELFNFTILAANWDADNNHVLLKVKDENDAINWVLLDVKNPDNSFNITHEFATDFSNVEILNNSANELLVLRNHNLHKINTSNRHISAVLASNVQSFDHFGTEIVLVAGVDSLDKTSADSLPEGTEYYVGIIESGSDKIIPITSSQGSTRTLLSEFYGEKYITILENQTISVYKKDKFEKIFTGVLEFVPDLIKIGHDNEFVFMNAGTNVAALDMEAMIIRDWLLPAENYGWLDDYMVYSVADGQLNVYDFDGLNHRQLADNVSNHFPVIITENKWLYYFSDDKLIREWLVNK